MFSRILLSEVATFALRYPFQAQPDLQITPIAKIRLPRKRRDELPPILAGLPWRWMPPTLRAEMLALLEAAVLAGKAAASDPEKGLPDVSPSPSFLLHWCLQCSALLW